MRSAASFAIACACLALAGPARAGIGVGVADNTLLGNADGGAAYLGVLNDVGLRELRLPVRWDPRGRPRSRTGTRSRLSCRSQRFAESMSLSRSSRRTRPRSPRLRRLRAGSSPSSNRSPARSRPCRTSSSATSRTSRTSGSPSSTRRGTNVSGGAYESLLAASYDALKAVDPGIDVIGLGLSSRGNDGRGAGNVSTSPVKFLEGMGAAYRRSGRTRPLMDELAYHPYPRRDTDSLTTGILWPNAGATDLDRIKQAVWDAFHGTGQQTFEDGLRVRLDEVGWQVAIPRNRLDAYFGAETVEPTTEASQASIYASLVRYEACDPSVDALLFLGLRDEPNLSRWQAGLMRADGSPRPSYRSVQTVLSQTGGELRWPSTNVAALDDRGWRRSDLSERPSPAEADPLLGLHRNSHRRCALPSGRLPPAQRPATGARPVRARSHRSARDALDPLSAPPPRAGPIRLLDPPQSRSKPKPQDPPHEPPLRRHSLIEPRPVPGTRHVQLRQTRRGGPRRHRSR